MTQSAPSRRLQITLEPTVLRWARKRVNLTPEELAKGLKVKPDRVTEWEQSGKISIARQIDWPPVPIRHLATSI